MDAAQEIFTQARDKAHRLVKTLEAQEAQMIEAIGAAGPIPPPVSIADLTAGRALLQQAVAAARHALQNLEDAAAAPQAHIE